jgi:hypothetical protein
MKWISVKERLPTRQEEDLPIFVLHDNKIHFGEIWFETMKCADAGCADGFNARVTHWTVIEGTEEEDAYECGHVTEKMPAFCLICRNKNELR